MNDQELSEIIGHARMWIGMHIERLLNKQITVAEFQSYFSGIRCMLTLDEERRIKTYLDAGEVEFALKIINDRLDIEFATRSDNPSSQGGNDGN